jgi:hypothetical protein
MLLCHQDFREDRGSSDESSPFFPVRTDLPGKWEPENRDYRIKHREGTFLFLVKTAEPWPGLS